MAAKLVSPVVKLSKQKLITGTIVDVLGDLCSVRLSGQGAVLHSLRYLGQQPAAGDAVTVDYRSGTPVVHTNSDNLTAQIEDLQSQVQATIDATPVVGSAAPEIVQTVEVPEPTWGAIIGTLSDQIDLQAELDAKSDVGHGHDADEITLDTSTFDNNLDGSITNVQLLAEAVDELVSTSGSAVVPVTVVGEREFLQVETPGALAVASNICPPLLMVRNVKILKVYIICEDPGSAGSTIVDIHLEGTGTIWTTTANRPELAYTDTYAVSGEPDISEFVLGDVLSVHIDQIATGASDLRIVIVEETDELVFADHVLVTTEL